MSKREYDRIILYFTHIFIAFNAEDRENAGGYDINSFSPSLLFPLSLINVNLGQNIDNDFHSSL